MRYFADLHIHSCFSRATSRQCTLPFLSAWAAVKGIHLLGTGDFTHPGWMDHLQSSLIPCDSGFHRLREDSVPVEMSGYHPLEIETRFVLTSEISCIYKRNGVVHKVHNLLVVPDFGAARRINKRLSKIGNLKADGRPILGLDARDLLEILLECSESGFLVPAHVWTPWFSVFGARSGFDGIDACFRDLASHIFALETGLSADPEMIRRISALDRFTLISNSDAHSPIKLGREVTRFDTGFNFDAMRCALEQPESGGFRGTIEFYPEEGKYFLDGHRACRKRLTPEETRAVSGLCPVCEKPLTTGVLSRVEQLADREQAVYQRYDPDFINLIPLPEMLTELAGVKTFTPRVQARYLDIINRFGSELGLLIDIPVDDIVSRDSELLGESVRRAREGIVMREPGYDGQYGVIRLFRETEKSGFSPEAGH